MKKRVAGILLITISLGLLAFWELWGRENLSYDRIVVFKKAAPKFTVITSDMLQEKRVEAAPEGAIKISEVSELEGMTTCQFVPAGTELHKEYFIRQEFATGKEIGKYILSIPDQWLKSYPQTLKRGDKAFFYCGGEIVTSAVVAYVRDAANQEVQYGDTGRLSGSAAVSLIEVIVTEEQAVLLGKLADKGNKFVIMYY